MTPLGRTYPPGAPQHPGRTQQQRRRGSVLVVVALPEPVAPTPARHPLMPAQPVERERPMAAPRFEATGEPVEETIARLQAIQARPRRLGAYVRRPGDVAEAPGLDIVGLAGGRIENAVAWDDDSC